MHIVYVNVVSRDESINDAKPDFLAVYLTFFIFSKVTYISFEIIELRGELQGLKLVFFIVESQHKNR